MLSKKYIAIHGFENESKKSIIPTFLGTSQNLTTLNKYLKEDY